MKSRSQNWLKNHLENKKNQIRSRLKLEILENRLAMTVPTAANPLVFFGDVNGDKLTDKISTFSDPTRGLIVETELKNGTSQPIVSVLGDGSGVFQNPPLSADVNGDGRTDLVFMFSNTAGSHLRVALGQSDGHFGNTIETVLADGSGIFQKPVQVTDVNGDGLSDLSFTFVDSKLGLVTRSSLGQTSGHFSNTVESTNIVGLSGGNAVALLKGNILQTYNGMAWSVNNSRTIGLASIGNGRAATLLNDGTLQIYDSNGSHTDNTRTAAIASLGANKAAVLLTDQTLQFYDSTGSHTNNTRTLALVSLGGGKAAILLNDGTYQEFNGSTWTTNNTRTMALVSLGGNKAASLLNDGTYQEYDGATWKTNNTRTMGLVNLGANRAAVLLNDGTYQEYDGTTWKTINSRTVGLVALGVNTAAALLNDGTYQEYDGSAWKTNNTRTMGLVRLGVNRAASLLNDGTYQEFDGSKWKTNNTRTMGLVSLGVNRAASLLNDGTYSEYDGISWKTNNTRTRGLVRLSVNRAASLLTDGTYQEYDGSIWKTNNTRTVSLVNLGGNKAAVLLDDGTYQEYDGKSWQTNNTRTVGLVNLGWDKAASLLSDGTYQEFDGLSWKTKNTRTMSLAILGVNQAGCLLNDGTYQEYDGNSWKKVNQTTSALVGLNNGKVYRLENNENLIAFDGKTWSTNNTRTLGLAAISGTKAAVLLTDGKLTIDDGQSSRDDNTRTKSISQLATYKVAVLLTDGTLQIYDAKGSKIDNNRTQDITGLVGGKTAVLLTDGTLKIYDGTNSKTDNSRTKGISHFGAGNAAVLLNDGTLQFYDASGSHNNNSRTLAVGKIGPGETAILLNNGQLQIQDGSGSHLDNSRTVFIASMNNGNTAVLLNDASLQSYSPSSSVTLSSQAALSNQNQTIWYLGNSPVDRLGNLAVASIGTGTSNGTVLTPSITDSALGSKWFSLGGPNSSLGLPIENVHIGQGYTSQTFQNGAIFESSDTGAQVILGTGTNPNTFLGLFIQKSTLSSSTTTPLFTPTTKNVNAAISTYFDPTSRLGLPAGSQSDVSDATGVNVGQVQYFQNGAIFYSNATKQLTYVSHDISSVFQTYQKQGLTLGVPTGTVLIDTSPAGTSPGSVSQSGDLEAVPFTSGVVYWTPDTGGRVQAEPGTILALGQTPDENASGLGLTDGTDPIQLVKNLANQHIGIHASAQGTLSLNLMQQTAYADVQFMGAHFDTGTLESIANGGQLQSGNFDVFEALSSTLRGSITSGYDDARKNVYQSAASKNQAVYFSSSHFVDWASPQTLARLTAQTAVGFGSESLNEVKQQLLSELKSMVAWATTRYGGDEKLALANLGSAFLQGKIHAKEVSVKYTYSALGKSFSENHLGFEITIDGLNNISLAPLNKYLALGATVSQVAQGIKISDIQSSVTNLALDIFAKQLGLGQIDTSVLNFSASGAEAALNAALYAQLFKSLGVSQSMLSQAFNLNNNDSVIDLLKLSGQLHWNGLTTLESFIKSKLPTDFSFKITEAKFDTGTYELTFKAELHYDHDWGSAATILDNAGKSLVSWGKSTGGKISNWVKTEGGYLANWAKENLKDALDPTTHLPILGNYQLPDWMKASLPNIPAKASLNGISNAIQSSPVGKGLKKLGLGLTDGDEFTTPKGNDYLAINLS